MRNTFASTFYDLGKEDPRLVVVVADISPAGSIARFREDFPDRFINTGVAEQVMIGFCAGMAQRGLRPFAYTIATFSVFRPFEMIRDDLCYQDLPVTVVGIGGGVTYSTLGSTHHAMEDVAVMSAIPNMNVVAPCDPAETAAATRWLAKESQHPTYLRLGKAGEPDFTSNAVDPFEFGRLRTLRLGRNVAFLAYGPTGVKLAISLSDRIKEKTGDSATVISAHTIKPLDIEGVASVLKTHRKVVVLEEHVPHGGLGSRVKEVAWDTRASCDLRTFSLQDSFIHCYGSHQDLLDRHGFNISTVSESLGLD
ncbi:MAG: transketolase family protein [Leptospirales bacterium]